VRYEPDPAHPLTTAFPYFPPEEQEALERRIHLFCRGRLAAYKVPVVVEIAEGGHHGQRFKKIRLGATEGAVTRRPASA
jgi:hypothetical protein